MLVIWWIALGLTGVSGEILKREVRYPECFQFTWVVPKNNQTHLNCSDNSYVPCVSTFVVTDDSTPPNITKLWYAKNRTTISCPMLSGFVCIKYSYSYSNALLNTTYFCGQMTQDKTKAIEDGCFTHQVNGYTIEACACKSHVGGMPCNKSSQFRISLVALGFWIGLAILLNK